MPMKLSCISIFILHFMQKLTFDHYLVLLGGMSNKSYLMCISILIKFTLIHLKFHSSLKLQGKEKLSTNMSDHVD